MGLLILAQLLPELGLHPLGELHNPVDKPKEMEDLLASHAALVEPAHQRELRVGALAWIAARLLRAQVRQHNRRERVHARLQLASPRLVVQQLDDRVAEAERTAP